MIKAAENQNLAPCILKKISEALEVGVDDLMK